MSANAQVAASERDAAEAFQGRMLLEVSRTFALTIPQLPKPLETSVANAYLLCRIADTIEDEPALDAATKTELQDEFLAVLTGDHAPEAFARRSAPLLSNASLEAERELMAATPRVLELFRSLSEGQQASLTRCVAIMGRGMSRFQRHASRAGLRDLAETDRYCYYVAGVVGEMLTELFCEYDPGIAAHREELLALAPSFGEGLQLTNILKDVHEDRARGVCWLPGAEFADHGIDLPQVSDLAAHPGFPGAMRDLVGIARGHLEDALRFILLIPPHQAGIRRFCLWAVGMALLTLQRIQRRPGFAQGRDVKISRRSVRAVIVLTSHAARRDRWLRFLFGVAAAGLPAVPERSDRPTVSEWATMHPVPGRVPSGWTEVACSSAQPETEQL
jgi:farnesyl-diphosphate farnesyltransferase